MFPMGALPLRGLMKVGSGQAPGPIVCYQTAWMGWLILGCIAVSAKQSSSPSRRLENSVSASGPQVAAAPYAHPERHHLHVTRHYSSPSIYRSLASLKGGHGEWQNLQVVSSLLLQLLRIQVCVFLCFQPAVSNRERERNTCMNWLANWKQKELLLLWVSSFLFFSPHVWLEPQSYLWLFFKAIISLEVK